MQRLDRLVKGDKLANQLIARNAQVHDLVAHAYDQKHSEIYNAIEQARIEESLDQILSLCKRQVPQVLDFGAGTGNLSLKLLHRGCLVTAADVSEKSLALLADKAGDQVARLKLCVLTSDSLPFPDGAFDIVTNYSVLHHVPDWLGAVRELVRVLAPGGLLYIDHEACDGAWTPNEALIEYRRLGRLDFFTHLRMLFNTGELSTYDFWRSLFIKVFINHRYQREGDLHVWPDDHIEWDKIFALFQETSVEIIRKVDYLSFQPRAGIVTYKRFQSKCADTCCVIARRSQRNSGGG